MKKEEQDFEIVDHNVILHIFRCNLIISMA